MNATANDHVVLCNTLGSATGVADKMEAHKAPGMLHQAFSILVFRDDGREVLIQQRSHQKPLFAGRWANTCCSHPIESEDLINTATRRLEHEFGFTVSLTIAGSFVYRAPDDDRGVEHEHDTVLIGEAYDQLEPTPNPNEIADWKWIGVEDLLADMESRPDVYSPWFKPALEIALSARL